MVKGCMLRMGYRGQLNKANYLKACFIKPYKFFIHSVIHAPSHRKGGYDVMKDYQMYNITSASKSWVYPRFVQMMLDHAYPNLVKDEQNDLMMLNHMDNETLIRLSMYTKNWLKRKKTEFFGYIKDDKYEDPDPSAADELMKLEDFVETRNEWYTKEEKEKKVDEVSSEKKKLEKRVKSVESENSSLLKRVEADQVDIDILKVRIAVLEEEKARRDEKNEYFKLKNKELEVKNAKKEYDEYMLKKVIEDLIGKSIQQRFEEIELEEVRAKREAEIEAQMKDKGK
ncbi:hypothetical protein Hanom_Chr17g01578401 [Helianthus anomalus]